ncbi:MAG: tyrosine-type recombinase/integrase [Candidatus Woesearchaeota archaeon]
MGINPAYLVPVNDEVNAKKKKLPSIPSKEEILKLLAYVQDVRIGFTIFTCSFQGLRLGEVISLKWKDVNLQHGELKVVDGKNPRRFKSGYGKDRIVPINNMFLDIWKAWRAMNPEEEYVIPDVSDNGKRAPDKTLLRRFQKRLYVYLEKAELLEVESVQANKTPRYNYHFHTFRHVCGANLRRAGMTLENIRDFLGHADVDSTQIYTELTKEDIKEASHVAYAYPKTHLGMNRVPTEKMQADKETLQLQKEILEKQLELAKLQQMNEGFNLTGVKQYAGISQY